MDNTYRRLAEHLDALPNGFPLTKDGKEQRLLAKIFSPEEADLAAQLTSSLETAEEIARRTGLPLEGLNDRLKAMARRGLIEVDRKDNALAFKTMPFIVGIYEMQVHSMDAELAQLVEDYFREGFGGM